MPESSNGVYILRSENADGSQSYRVAECFAIEDLLHAKDSETQDAIIILKFGQIEPEADSTRLTARERAFVSACELFEKIPVCESGIRIITVDRPFPIITEEEAEEIVLGNN